MVRKISTREAYGNALAEFGKNSDIVVLDSDLSKSTMTKKFKDCYPDRFFNMGIAEANMMSVAAGIATNKKVVFASTYAIFANRAYEQIRNSICYPNLNVKIGASHAGITVGKDGATHQALEDIALARVIPNMTVVCPADSVETKKAVQAIIEHKGPVYLRLSRYPVPDIFNSDYNYMLGKGKMVVDGTDITIIATGTMVHVALQSSKLLTKENISARVINVHTIKPIDKKIIIKAAHETSKIFTVEEHNIIGGLGSAVSEVLSEFCPKVIKRIGVEDIFGKSGDPDHLLQMYGLTSIRIVNEVIKSL